MLYEITRTGNIISFKNLESVTLDFESILEIGCSSDESTTNTIVAGNTLSYTMTKDGKYIFKLIKNKDLEAEEIKVVEIPFYGTFLERIILTLENLFCGCGDCGDCVEYDVLLDAYFKILTYYTLTKRYYSAYVDVILSCAECEISEEVACIINDEKYLGGYNNVQFLKKLLAYYYLSFYFAEVNGENEAEIKTKFKYNTIVNCLKGVDIDCIKQNTEDMGTFTIEAVAYTNQPPSEVGDFSLGVQNREVKVLTSAMFTTGTTPAYADPEGDPADAIRIDSLPASGTVEYDGTPVTVGQIVSIADIDLGLLTYVAPNQDAVSSSNFNFSVRDSGSLTFVS